MIRKAKWSAQSTQIPVAATAKDQLLLLAAVADAVTAWVFFVSWRSSRIETDRRKDPVSPYLNTRSEVKYLGDAACVGCHPKSSRNLPPASDGPFVRSDPGGAR